MKIIFTRHTQTNYNIKGLYNDIPDNKVVLTKTGQKQAEELAKMLKERDIEVIFVSEFIRTKQTAQIVNKYHKVPIIIDKRLNERKTGFNNKPSKELEKELANNKFKKLKNGESYHKFKKRVKQFLYYLRKLKYNTILVITHGSVFKIIKGIKNKLNDDQIVNVKFPKINEIIEMRI